MRAGRLCSPGPPSWPLRALGAELREAAALSPCPFHARSISITTSCYPLPSICVRDAVSDWFESLAQCLHWNVRKKQAHFPEEEEGEEEEGEEEEDEEEG